MTARGSDIEESDSQVAIGASRRAEKRAQTAQITKPDRHLRANDSLKREFPVQRAGFMWYHRLRWPSMVAGRSPTGKYRTGLESTVVNITSGATIEGFTITKGGGTTTNAGGIFISSASPVTVSNNIITDNHPAGDLGIPAGGILVSPGSSAVIIGNDIKGNTSLSIGGVMVHAGGTVDLINNYIRGNGGALPLGGVTITGGMLYGATGIMVNNQITGNRGSGIGGFYYAGGFSGSSIEIINNTIYGNLADTIVPPGFSTVGGVFLDDGGSVTIVNTIIQSNFGSLPFSDIVAGTGFSPGDLDMSYSHVGTIGPGLPPGLMMITPGIIASMFAAPAMASPAGPTAAGDFSLLTISPDKNTGLDGAFPFALPPFDLAGDPRFVSTIDIGAFEFSEEMPQPPSPAPGGIPEPFTAAHVIVAITFAAIRRRK